MSAQLTEAGARLLHYAEQLSACIMLAAGIMLFVFIVKLMEHVFVPPPEPTICRECGAADDEPHYPGCMAPATCPGCKTTTDVHKWGCPFR